ncbi:MAG TPA: di-trans,poly-cis-decaprenylcistransferase [Candidatus Bathyarchaeota archaeon]|nr:MAG: di-trans,poly-cis-decaprenylcistransferase [Candidatus Bathyarchaeota archaeon]HDO81673.1 di-trans,poly-cis-decaprenylcistransferase [Candidatus Bathyarchaeota archaeon]HEW89785.1 di-trans,poly-cis-decaprenylcistransferase [Candidatus Bathyarchaeota archaeon]
MDVHKVRQALLRIGAYDLYERWLELQVRGGPMPDHVGVILDGNRRWARMHGLEPWQGHRAGAKRVEELLRWCLELGIKTVTLYAFSTENFKRSPREVLELMKLFEEELRRLKESDVVREHKVRVKVIGRLELLPPDIRKLAGELEEATKEHDGHYLNIAIAYGGRAEIVDAVRKIARDVKAGLIEPEEISEELFERYLYTSYLPEAVRDPDLIIRTSGEERLSGFLLWQSAYSELCFVDVFWPEFRRIDLLRAIRTYQGRQRRFGR